jgi:DNA-binding HxlR family transcriptional regulator
MDAGHRSGCPINLSLEVFGDRWSLIILRDMVFGGRRHFRELLTQSEEGISSNILADRLKMLLDQGMMTKTDDPTHKQKAIYSLTEKAIALVPVFAQLGAWGRRYTPATEELSIRAQLLEEGGPAMWNQFMSELAHATWDVRIARKAPRLQSTCRPLTTPYVLDEQTQKDVNFFAPLAYISNVTASRICALTEVAARYSEGTKKKMIASCRN